MASGDNFSDKSNPRVMVQVGQTGQSGDVEMQDLMFTVKGAMAGAILLEWNLRSSSAGAIQIAISVSAVLSAQTSRSEIALSSRDRSTQIVLRQVC